MCPVDNDCYFGEPELYMPKYEEVHISVTFTWDKNRGEYLKKQWEVVCSNIKIGGPAYGESRDKFVSGMYLKKGIVITSRGCNNNCKWCLVGHPIKEINISEGNIIQDNNILQCSKSHLRRVFDMLKKQKAIEFKGGLQIDLITTDIIDEFRSLRIKNLWTACDTKNSTNLLKAVGKNLLKYFKKYKLRCYVLIGDDMKENENRLKEVYISGFMPFAQLFQPADRLIEYSEKWKQFARQWSRPAIYESFFKEN